VDLVDNEFAYIQTHNGKPALRSIFFAPPLFSDVNTFVDIAFWAPNTSHKALLLYNIKNRNPTRFLYPIAFHCDILIHDSADRGPFGNG